MSLSFKMNDASNKMTDNSMSCSMSSSSNRLSIRSMNPFRRSTNTPGAAEEPIKRRERNGSADYATSSSSDRRRSSTTIPELSTVDILTILESYGSERDESGIGFMALQGLKNQPDRSEVRRSKTRNGSATKKVGC